MASVTLSKTSAYPGDTVKIDVNNGLAMSGSYRLRYGAGAGGSGTIASGEDVITKKSFSWTVPYSATNKLAQHVMQNGSAAVTIYWTQYDDYTGQYARGNSSLTVQRVDIPSFQTDKQEYGLGSTVVFTIRPSTSLYRHKITYVCGGKSGTAVPEFSGTSSSAQTQSFILPSDLQMGDSIVFTLHTMFGGTDIGTSSISARLSSPLWLAKGSCDVGDTVVIHLSLSGAWTLVWEYGGSSHELYSGAGGEYEWVVPLGVGKAFPSARSGEITVRGTAGGETYEAKLTVNVPDKEENRPSVSYVLSPAGEQMSVSPSIYYQVIRGVQAEISASSPTSSIYKYELICEGVASESSSPSLRSQNFRQSGPVEVTVNVYDQRGYVTSVTETLTVEAYARPYIVPHSGDIRPVAERRGSESKDLYCRFGASCTVINGTEGSVKLRIDEGEWQTIAPTASGKWEGAQTLLNALPDITAVYKIYLCAEDALGISNVLLVEVSSTGTPLHLAEGGRRIGFGGFVNNATQDRTHHFWKSIFHAGADLSDNLCGKLNGGAGSWEWSQTRDTIDLFNLFLCEVLSGETVQGCFLACRAGNILMGQQGGETLKLEKSAVWGLASCAITSGTEIRIIAIL